MIRFFDRITIFSLTPELCWKSVKKDSRTICPNRINKNGKIIFICAVIGHSHSNNFQNILPRNSRVSSHSILVQTCLYASMTIEITYQNHFRSIWTYSLHKLYNWYNVTWTSVLDRIISFRIDNNLPAYDQIEVQCVR